jgi:hypothetical protein
LKEEGSSSLNTIEYDAIWIRIWIWIWIWISLI